MSGDFGLFGVTVGPEKDPYLEDVDLVVRPGEVAVLVGADGAGKTTACRTLSGLLSARAGQVRRPPDGRVGYQPEAGGTWDDLTVGENLDFVARAYGTRNPERRDELLAITRLSPAEHRLAGNLSGGMRQKLAVAMAMLSRPDLLVLDEPTTGLDPVSRGELWRLLARAAAEGLAVLATTTYLDEADRAHHVVVLDAGRVIAHGTTAAILESFQGAMSTTEHRPAQGHSWRRGRLWRVWSENGTLLEGHTPVPPDLEDLVTTAALTRRETA